MTSQSCQTFRFRGVPDGYARRDVGDLVKRALSLATDARLKVYSLAANPYGRGKVVTVVFNRMPDFFYRCLWKGVGVAFCRVRGRR